LQPRKIDFTEEKEGEVKEEQGEKLVNPENEKPEDPKVMQPEIVKD
jgi:hypothetical protein